MMEPGEPLWIAAVTASNRLVIPLLIAAAAGVVWLLRRPRR